MSPFNAALLLFVVLMLTFTGSWGLLLALLAVVGMYSFIASMTKLGVA